MLERCDGLNFEKRCLVATVVVFSLYRLVDRCGKLDVGGVIKFEATVNNTARRVIMGDAVHAEEVIIVTVGVGESG